MGTSPCSKGFDAKAVNSAHEARGFLIAAGMGKGQLCKVEALLKFFPNRTLTLALFNFTPQLN